MNILAIDPGGTTGVCEVAVEGQNISAWRTWEIKTDYEWVELLASHGSTDLIIVESFVIWSHTAQGQIGTPLPASKGVGKVELIAQILGVKLLIQTPSQKAHIDDETVKLFFNTTLPKSPHERDAMRHIVFYLLKEAYGNK